MYTHIYTYIHIYIYTCLHTYMHACMHTYIHTYVHNWLLMIVIVIMPRLRLATVHVFIILLPDPGALSSCMRTLPEKHAGHPGPCASKTTPAPPPPGSPRPGNGVREVAREQSCSAERCGLSAQAHESASLRLPAVGSIPDRVVATRVRSRVGGRN